MNKLDKFTYIRFDLFWYRIALESHAGVAQLVEQRTENPRVGGSIPSPGTIVFSALQSQPAHRQRSHTLFGSSGVPAFAILYAGAFSTN